MKHSSHFVLLSVCLILYASISHAEYLAQGVVLCELSKYLSDIKSKTSHGWRCNDDGIPLTGHCQWDGVVCNVDNDVIKIDLKRRGIEGRIPQSIGFLQSLKVLNMQQNSFSGTIPQSIGDLTNLQILNLNSNRFHGSLPPQWSGLHEVVFLNVFGNSLEGTIPSSYSALHNLRELYLNKNNLEGSLPTEMSKSITLQILELSDNPRLTGPIADVFCSNAPLLQVLRIENTAVQCVAECLYDREVVPKKEPSMIMPTCETPAVPYVPEAVQVEEFHALCRLLESTNIASLNRTLFAPGWECAMTVHDPEQPPLLLPTSNPCYTWPYIHCTSSSNTVRMEKEAQHVLDIMMSRLGINGTLPSEIGAFTNLEVLSIDGNHFHGTVPGTVGKLTALKSMHMCDNSLSGVLPNTMGGMGNLVHLSAHSNRLQGLLPYSMGSLDKLDFLYLNNNHFSGTVPTSVRHLTFVEYVYLQGNQFSGSLPFTTRSSTETGSTANTNLKFLDVSSNNVGCFYSDLIQEDAASTEGAATTVMKGSDTSSVMSLSDSILTVDPTVGECSVPTPAPTFLSQFPAELTELQRMEEVKRLKRERKREERGDIVRLAQFNESITEIEDSLKSDELTVRNKLALQRKHEELLEAQMEKLREIEQRILDRAEKHGVNPKLTPGLPVLTGAPVSLPTAHVQATGNPVALPVGVPVGTPTAMPTVHAGDPTETPTAAPTASPSMATPPVSVPVPVTTPAKAPTAKPSQSPITAVSPGTPAPTVGVRVAKTCAQPCQHGKCTATNAPLTCYSDNTTCSMFCLCDTNYAGIACSIHVVPYSSTALARESLQGSIGVEPAHPVTTTNATNNVTAAAKSVSSLLSECFSPCVVFPQSKAGSIFDPVAAAASAGSGNDIIAMQSYLTGNRTGLDAKYCALYAGSSCSTQGIKSSSCMPMCLKNKADCLSSFCNIFSSLDQLCPHLLGEVGATPSPFNNTLQKSVRQQCMTSSVESFGATVPITKYTISMKMGFDVSSFLNDGFGVSALEDTVSSLTPGVLSVQVSGGGNATRRRLSERMVRNLVTADNNKVRLTITAIPPKGTTAKLSVKTMVSQLSESVKTNDFSKKFITNSISYGSPVVISAMTKATGGVTDPTVLLAIVNQAPRKTTSTSGVTASQLILDEIMPTQVIEDPPEEEIVVLQTASPSASPSFAPTTVEEVYMARTATLWSYSSKKIVADGPLTLTIALLVVGAILLARYCVRWYRLYRLHEMPVDLDDLDKLFPPMPEMDDVAPTKRHGAKDD